MQVTTDSERALHAQRMVLELLQSDMPETSYTLHNEVDVWAEELAVGKPRFAPRARGRAGPVAPGHRRSTSTPASSAPAACAPAATSR